jgi:hypothetical protein
MSESSSEELAVTDRGLDPKAFFDDALMELQRATRQAAEVHMDLAARGPLYQYAMERRDVAMRAMVDLLNFDAKDAVEIAVAQAMVKEYLAVCSFVEVKIFDGQTADQEINARWGDPKDEQPEHDTD